MNTYPPSMKLSEQARHIVFLLCLRVIFKRSTDIKSSKAFAYFSKISAVIDLLTISSESSFYSSFWRMVFQRSSLQEEVSLIHRMVNEANPTECCYSALIRSRLGICSRVAFLASSVSCHSYSR